MAHRPAGAAKPHRARPDDPSAEAAEPTPEAYLALDRAGVVIDWSAEAQRLLGWARSEILGRRLEGTVLARGLGEAELAEIAAPPGGPAAARRVELAALDRDGHAFPAELVLWAGGEDVVHALVYDASERHTGREACSQLASIVDSSSAMIFSHDLEGRILSWNRAAELTLGYSADDVLGQNVRLIVPPARRAEVERVTERVRRGEHVPPHGSVRRRKDGTELEVSLTVSAICDGEDRVTGASAIAQDLTEQRWLVTTLDDALDSLQQALGAARAAEARSRRFLADAAHQLRTPLASIRALAEAAPGVPAGEREQLLYTLAREGARAGRLVGSLLTLARLDEVGPLQPASCDLLALCREEAERARALSRDLEVTVRALDWVATDTELDRGALGEILEALLDNARRHAKRQIEVQVAATEGSVELRVGDDGPGVPEELVERVFERFVSLDGKGGSGLGLPIARSLARAHGGDLTYERGSFVVRLAVGVAALEAQRGGPGS